MIGPGSIIGHRYRILELIGAGGMANVYLAVNLATRKHVAIKMLQEEFIHDAEFLRRFEREAKAVLHLEHENIVRAYGVGEAENLPYIVLEYIEGQTLKQIVTENGPMPSRLAVSMGLQILDALGAAHRAGIIHRDVKPQNVIVTPEGKCKLTDFGIARDVQSKTITFAGSTILGSVYYISPEQAQGKPVTEASDLYSLGVLLYELLTGKLPFDGDNSVAIALMHINDEPTPPIQLNPKIPPSLNDVIMRALNKNLSERFASAKEMSKYLRRTLTEPNGDFARVYTREQAAATPTTLFPEKKKKKRKKLHGTLKIGIIVAALVLAVIGLFALLSSAFNEQPSGMALVPALTQRSQEEALERAESYGFKIEINHELSDTVPYGQVIDQSPNTGEYAKNGATIYVTVSLGKGRPVVPDLIGLSPDDAKAALESAGLHLGTQQYTTSDVALGCVCSQNVTAGTELDPNSYVDIWISANTSSTVTMPKLTDEVLNLALSMLAKEGFSNVSVRSDFTSNAENGLVIAQQPANQEKILTDTPVTVTVSASTNMPYSSDVAYNLDIQESATAVSVVLSDEYEGFAFSRIVYEATMEKGEKIPVSFTVYSDSDAARILHLFVNGVERDTREITFTARVS